MVSIDQKKCLGCGLCVKDCFFDVLQIKDGKAEVSGDCFGCGHCVALCPANAVTMPDYPMEEVRESDESCRMHPENLLHFMQFRRSVRQFQKEPVPMESMHNILEAGRYTPTAANRQDVSYILIKENLDEFKKIVWVDKATLVKQTIAVTIITVVLAVIISVFDSAILEGINLLVK